MGAPPVLFSNVGTLGEMNARVCRWARERINSDMVNDAINDAIESLWQSVSLSTLSRFVSSAVTQTILANTTSFPVVSVADPTASLGVGATPGGALPDRTVEFAFSYATDSGSQTQASPAVVQALTAGTLAVVTAPDPAPEAIGWNLFAGVAGQMVQQNVYPLSFTVSWIEPLLGASANPNGPFPSAINTTGDNIASIARLDISNYCGTSTSWDQSDIASALFTGKQHWLPTTSTFSGHAYDLVNNSRVEFRPASNYDLAATLFFIVRPRRLAFPNSRIPFNSFAHQEFIGNKALAAILLSLGESEGAMAWDKKAEEARLRICLSILGESWNKNITVRRYM